MKESAEDFWKRVKILLNEKHLKQETLADDIGVGYNNVKQWMFHERFPPVYDVLKIAKTLNTSIEYLVNGEENKSLADPDSDKFFVPVLDQKLSAGFGQLLPEEPEIKGYMEVPRYLRQYGDKLAILSVEGDSMEPTLRRGDLVLCDSCGYDGEGLYAVQYDGDGFVKRVFRRAGKYVIMSDNPLYPQMEEPVGSDAIAIVGRVHGVFKRID